MFLKFLSSLQSFLWQDFATNAGKVRNGHFCSILNIFMVFLIFKGRNEKCFGRNLCVHVPRNIVFWKKKWVSTIRKMKTWIYRYLGAFWEIFFPKKNFWKYNFLCMSSKKFRPLSETFSAGCRNCILRVQRNILGFKKMWTCTFRNGKSLEKGKYILREWVCFLNVYCDGKWTKRLST